MWTLRKTVFTANCDWESYPTQSVEAIVTVKYGNPGLLAPCFLFMIAESQRTLTISEKNGEGVKII